jgi:ABC-type transporter Mla subunit MlaD
METWQAIALILLAVLVGAAVPALLRLYSTLGAARQLLEQTGPKLDRTLSELEQTVKRLNRTGIVLENGVKSRQTVFDTATEIGQALRQFRDNLQTAANVAAALGPAIAAAARALTDYVKPRQKAARPNGPEEPVTNEPEQPAVVETAAPEAPRPPGATSAAETPCDESS